MSDKLLLKGLVSSLGLAVISLMIAGLFNFHNVAMAVTTVPFVCGCFCALMLAWNAIDRSE